MPSGEEFILLESNQGEFYNKKKSEGWTDGPIRELLSPNGEVKKIYTLIRPKEYKSQ